MDHPHFTQKDREELTQLSAAIQNHFTEDAKNFAEIKGILISQNRDFKVHSELVLGHMEAVAPMLKKYERNVIANDVYGERGKTIIKWFMVASGLVGAGYVLKDFLMKLIFKI